MASSYTLKPLTEVADAAPGFGVDATQEVRFARSDLDAEQVGFTLHRVKPGTRQGIGHRHEHPEAEEGYGAISGAGRVKLGDETFEIPRLDAVSGAPADV